MVVRVGRRVIELDDADAILAFEGYGHGANSSSQKSQWYLVHNVPAQALDEPPLSICAEERMAKMLIAGEQVDSATGDTLEIHNPATGEVVDRVPKGTAADVEQAVQA